MNIGTLLPRHERYRGGHPALVIGGRTISYRELNAYVNRFANALLAAGLKKGDKFATILPNRLELMAAYWAAAKTGLVIVPLSPLLQGHGLKVLLLDSDTRLVLGDAGFAEVYRVGESWSLEDRESSGGVCTTLPANRHWLAQVEDATRRTHSSRSCSCSRYPT
jgi:acyl-CoA synthetase (AMP-forming)/AMP-acid ligase II